MHPDAELIQRLLDGELPAEVEPGMRAHLETCAECRRLAGGLRREEGEQAELLRLLDHPAPSVTPVAIIARAHHARRHERWRRAAVVALTLGVAGAAYAAPGSPLRGWVTEVIQSLRNTPSSSTAAPPASERPDQTEVAGISLPPGERLVVSFVARQGRGYARVTLAPDLAEVTVRAPAGAATFVAGVDTLTVDNRGSAADYAIGIPAAAALVEIRVADVSVFRKQGSAITTSAATEGPDSTYRIPLGP